MLTTCDLLHKNHVSVCETTVLSMAYLANHNNVSKVKLHAKKAENESQLSQVRFMFHFLAFFFLKNNPFMSRVVYCQRGAKLSIHWNWLYNEIMREICVCFFLWAIFLSDRFYLQLQLTIQMNVKHFLWFTNNMLLLLDAKQFQNEFEGIVITAI